MELALKVAPHHIDWSTLRQIAVDADRGGVYGQFWHFDHFYPIQGDTAGPCLESWVTLSAIAEATERIRIGCMVNGMHHRHPAVLANMASALDIVSGGRFELGLGAGWNEEESSAYGLTLGSLTERFDRLDEGLKVITSLLSQPTTTFEGRHFRLVDARNEPKGPQQPLPICIGGTGERRTLRAVARHATHWNLPFFDAATFAHKREILAAHCVDAGTDVDAIVVSTHVFVTTDTEPGAVIDELDAIDGAGIDQAVLYFQPPTDPELVDRITAAVADRAG